MFSFVSLIIFVFQVQHPREGVPLQAASLLRWVGHPHQRVCRQEAEYNSGSRDRARLVYYYIFLQLILSYHLISWSLI